MKKYLFSILLTLSLFTNGYALTLAEIRADIRVKIGDAKTDTNNRHWSDTILNSRINIIQDEIAEATLCLQARISTPTVAEQREYNYNSDVIAPIRIAYMVNSTSATVYLSTTAAYKRLEYVTVAGLDKTYGWESATSNLPTKYYERGSKYGFYPTPSAVYSSTWAVQIDYFKRPDALTVDTTAPFDQDVLLYSYHKLLILGVVIMCREDERMDTSALKTEYWALLQKMGADIKTRNDKQGGFSVR